MSKLLFHKCRICGNIFYHFRRDTYCSKCIPVYTSNKDRTKIVYDAIEKKDGIEAMRAIWRENWHKRMQSPEFREKERMRSLARAKANKKYLIMEVKNEVAK